MTRHVDGQRFKKRSALGGLVLLLTVGGGMAEDPPEQVYQNIKEVETQYLVPRPVTDVEMGTFDAAVGGWDGLASEEELVRVPNKPDRLQRRTPHVMVNAVDVRLVFHAVNAPRGFSVVVNGRRGIAGPGRADIGVRIGREQAVSWTICADSKSYSDRLIIDRPSVIGGAFTIPALPVAIVYEPPQNHPLNKASQTVSLAMSVSTSTSFSSDESTTRPVSGRFSTVTEVRGKLASAGDALGKLKNPVAQAFSTGIKLIADGLGKAETNRQWGSSQDRTDTLQTTDTRTASTETYAHQGPGRGDLFVVLKNARMVWICENGQVTVALLGYDEPVNVLASTLRGDLEPYEPRGAQRRFGGIQRIIRPKSPFSAETIRALLALDPFVAGGSGASLEASRFRRETAYYLNGVKQTYQYEHTIEQSDLATSLSYDAWLEDYSAGWLAALGLGVTETKKVKSACTYKSTQGSRVGRKVTAQVEFYADADQHYEVEVFYDRVFCTFALRPGPEARSATPVYQGTAADSNGRPLTGALVTLRVGGRTFQTHADARGHYEFHSPDISAGPATLTVGSMVRPIQIQNRLTDGRVSLSPIQKRLSGGRIIATRAQVR